MKRACLGSGCSALLLAALLSCGSSGDTSPGIVAVLIGFPSGGAPPGFGGAVVEVVDTDDGEPVTDAIVVVNGVALPWSPATQAYEGVVDVEAGGTVTLAVTTGMRTYRASATFFTEAPAIALPSPPVWPARCDNRLAWSDGQPPATGPTFIAFLDAGDPGGDSLSQTITGPPGSGEIAIGGGGLSPGEWLVFVGTSLEAPVPGAAAGSVLVLVNGRTAPLAVADADFREIAVQPAHRGIGTGERLSLVASGPLCTGFGSRDLTASATWSTSDEAVVGVSNAPGSAGVAAGVGPGTATVTAEVEGIRGATAIGVRDFTARDSGDPGHLLHAVTWTGTAVVAVGLNAILTSPDGVEWTSRPLGTAAQLTGVAGSPGRVVAVQYGSGAVLTSADLSSWTAVDAGPSAGSGLEAVTWTGTRFVAVGQGGAIVTSPDGLAWTEHASGTPYVLSGVAAGGPRLVAVGGAGGLVGQVVTSPDGVVWTAQDLPMAMGYPRAVAWSGSQYLGIGFSGSMTSPDGLAWSPVDGGPGATAIAASPTEVMAVADSGEVAATADGRTWIRWKPGRDGLRGVAWAGDRWVIVGASGTILTSP